MNFKGKKALFIAHSYNSFQKEMIDSVCNNFKECHVMVRSNPIAEFSNYFPIPSLNRFKLSCKIDLKNLPSNVNVTSVPVYYAPIDSQYKILGDKHFKATDKKIQQNQINFDFVHSHFTWTAGYVGAKLKEKYDVPFIVTAHGYDIYKLPFKDHEWKKRIEYVLNSANHIITVSESNLECINKLDVSTPATVIPNGYDSNKFYPRNQSECRDQLNIPIDKSVILTVGNLEEIKGQKYLIEAMQEVVKNNKDVLCYIVGNGSLENKFKKQVSAAGLDNYVELVGAKLHNEIPIWMNACDVFVLPSLKESFGVVQIEAMSCGKPVVATRNGGSEEIIISENYGFLVEPKNPDVLAKYIIISLDKKWDEKCIFKYTNQYKLSRLSKKIREIYTKVDNT